MLEQSFVNPYVGSDRNEMTSWNKITGTVGYMEQADYCRRIIMAEVQDDYV